MSIPIERWGKDHWSTFAYIDTRIVDYGGEPSRYQMRCNDELHPQFRHISGKCPPTRLNDGEIDDHDDWSCLDDAEAAGLLENIGTGLHRVYRMTDEGQRIIAQLRAHKSNGGMFADFRPT